MDAPVVDVVRRDSRNGAVFAVVFVVALAAGLYTAWRADMDESRTATRAALSAVIGPEQEQAIDYGITREGWDAMVARSHINLAGHRVFAYSTTNRRWEWNNGNHPPVWCPITDACP